MAIKDFLEKLNTEITGTGTLGTESVTAGEKIIPCYKEYDFPEVERKEILRYAGIPLSRMKEMSLIGDKNGENSPDRPGPDVNYADNSSDENKSSIDQLESLVDDCLEMTDGKLTYRVAYCCMPVSFDMEGYPILPFKQHSDNLRTNLSGCCGAVIFVATIGSGIDMLIRRFERVSPAKGMMFQGIGAERVESLCNLFNGEVSKTAEQYGFKTKPRYSPGYGDLPITVQPEILKMTDAQRRLGITLNASYLMSPSKSVTAIIGIRRMEN